MSFTDLFIRRPVLASVVSLMILVMGLRAMGMLSVQQYPRTESATVTVFTTYYGADPQIMAGFITTPLENAIAQANGIDYMTSKSLSGLSQITVNLRLNYDSNRALTEINAKINSVLDQLPPSTLQPVVSVQAGQTIDAMYIAFSSDAMQPNQITDYLVRTVQPRLQAVKGVQTAEILGAKNFSLRAWLDPAKLAAYNLTAGDVSAALAANDYIAGLGMTKGQMVQATLNASTNLNTVEQFRNLVVTSTSSAVVRLQDVANVYLGSDDYDSQVAFNGKQAVLIGIKVAPTANVLDAVAGVRSAYPDLAAQFPEGLKGTIVYDSSKYVESSIREVISTLVEAVIIVTLVIFLFLGSPRSTLIPTVTIPLSLVGTFAMMLALGFSMNLLTLLALVLAIGLVVDDAIVVVESVNRRLGEGMPPLAAALESARELAWPIVAMTVVLVAVYVPIGFEAGLTGALFTEFAFTLAGAVVISGIIALTLSPMMCSKILKPAQAGDRSWETGLAQFVDRTFDRLRGRYSRALHGALDYLPVTAVFAVCVLGSIYFLYGTTKRELAPQEDQGIILGISTSAPNATLQQRELYAPLVNQAFSSHPETEYVFQTDVPGLSMAGLVLKPWDERTVTAGQLQPILQGQVSRVAGLQVVTFQLPSLPGAVGLPVQFIINSTGAFGPLDLVAQEFLKEALASRMFAFLNTDLRIDQPQSTVVIDRDKTALLGLKMSDVGAALAVALGGGYVNYFDYQGRSYKVIPQVEQSSRLNADQLLNYYVRTGNGTSVPLSTIARIETKAIPESLNHFQQLNSATIQGVAFPGVSQGEALAYLRDLAARTLPSGYSIDYGGPSRQYIQESGGFVVTFGFALIVIFLSLAALFESFRDPVIILLSVPMSIAGALLTISILGTAGVHGASMNIYTEVGLVTLMGLISKHGILIVEVANSLQREGKSKREAIEQAAAIRLRPVLMTTAAMVLGVAPLVAATGTGAVARFSLGLVIASGLSIGTLFTLFVVPSFYLMLAADHSKRADEEARASA
ncbi:MAG: multidrug efflux protein [Alphaproteobacteria bacterium]|nr:multidrug efflux protein [Alphaproteobacteria bacterium]